MSKRDEIEKVLRKRVMMTCQGIAQTAVGKRTDWGCQNIASVGRLFCKVHGAKGIPRRYIQPADLPALLDELANVLIPQTEESSK